MNATPIEVATTRARPAYVDCARSLSSLIEEAGPRVESARQLDEGVVAALHEAGLFRLLMPRWLDGGESAPSDFVEVIETLARADASTAWCLCQMNVCSISSVYLKPPVAHEIFGEPRAALAWGSTPDAKAVVAAGGYRVTGNWEFGSGCHEATWLGGHCAVVNGDGTPCLDEAGRPLERTVLFPKTSASISDEWHVIGLRGTGSDMYALRDLFIPADYTILALMRWPDMARRQLGLPYRFGASSLYASGFAGVALGNARAMLDSFVDLARQKVPRGGRNPLSENSIVQVELAEADTRLEAARVYLLHTLREVENWAMREGEVTLDQRMKIRAAGTFAIRVATGVVDRFYEMAGTTAIFEGNAFERRFRDAHTVSQHLQGRVSHFETVGKHLLGLETDQRFV
jgi:indole-3-acetate monooxygenase